MNGFPAGKIVVISAGAFLNLILAGILTFANAAFASGDLKLDIKALPEGQDDIFCAPTLNLPASSSGPSSSSAIISQLYSKSKETVIEHSRGSLAGPKGYDGDYIKTVTIVRTPPFGQYKLGLYELVEVIQFEESLNFEIKTTPLNYLHSAEVNEGRCDFARYQSI